MKSDLTAVVPDDNPAWHQFRHVSAASSSHNGKYSAPSKIGPVNLGTFGIRLTLSWHFSWKGSSSASKLALSSISVGRYSECEQVLLCAFSEARVFDDPSCYPVSSWLAQHPRVPKTLGWVGVYQSLLEGGEGQPQGSRQHGLHTRAVRVASGPAWPALLWLCPAFHVVAMCTLTCS